ncbi:MAG: hypothetical protein CMF42_05895 [Legionellales bacterium]|nr:hypothetical protein [Legionellales bacterium]OUX66943.1 MAG: hypothetical protein CBD38_04240 [bacterium TMED178]|tara:strand:+ start:593 stop:937 length:345 start_codon:yes stop_codon:yes gene_type:complete
MLKKIPFLLLSVVSSAFAMTTFLLEPTWQYPDTQMKVELYHKQGVCFYGIQYSTLENEGMIETIRECISPAGVFRATADSPHIVYDVYLSAYMSDNDLENALTDAGYVVKNVID